MEQWQKVRWPKSDYTVHALVEKMGNDDHVGVNLRVLLCLLFQIVHLQPDHVSSLYWLAIHMLHYPD